MQTARVRAGRPDDLRSTFRKTRAEDRAGYCSPWPNPTEHRRARIRVPFLYARVVKSMAMYGAPFWSKGLKKKGREILRRIECVMAITAMRAYQSAFFQAAVALAGMIPLDLQAAAEVKVYRQVDTETSLQSTAERRN
ncbi:unnamed protein product [Heterotrigona itama]|uniref:Uncharacterized protein n=1 Tax=Heterotrigona itama TaxID=395501 RepID=A0A6V7HJ73_9HYME|nr:unnamed protein product [Heterotrigona itama]